MLLEEIIDFFDQTVFSDAPIIEACVRRSKSKKPSANQSPFQAIMNSSDIYQSEIVPFS